VTIGCANFSEQLLEDELFGHEPGAFTGATKLKPGKVELADGGTLFFDEIGELPRELQAKLLRFLENKTYTRVGGNKEREADVRLISATNRNLASEVKKGTFREDLYYRLNVCPVTLPPLRERAEDIPDLVNHFMKEMAAKQSRKPLVFSDEAMDVLKKFHWPGNVRELRNVAERVTILTEGEIIETEDLPTLDSATAPAIPMGGYREKIMEHEKTVLLSALEQSDWNQSEAARKLKLNRTHFIRLMNRYGLKRDM
jgi:DNA-binding NtrC family response regulator